MRALLNNRHVLGLLFMLPAGVLLLLFLTCPLGLGTWLGFTDTKVGRAGVSVGFDKECVEERELRDHIADEVPEVQRRGSR
jgi:ABC-type sugar transport system permease subunit